MKAINPIIQGTPPIIVSRKKRKKLNQLEKDKKQRTRGNINGQWYTIMNRKIISKSCFSSLWFQESVQLPNSTLHLVEIQHRITQWGFQNNEVLISTKRRVKNINLEVALTQLDRLWSKNYINEERLWIIIFLLLSLITSF